MRRHNFTHPEVAEFMNHKFDFNKQHKDTYDDWLKAFSEAIRKRCKGKCFIGVSSGYDSGAISYEMTKQGVDFKAYSLMANEHKLIIDRRSRYIKNHQKIEPGDWFERYRQELEKKIENAPYTIKYDGKIRDQSILDDQASVALAYMCDTAVKEGWTTYVSTQGADEILSDYGLWPSQSTYKGTFPDDLKEWYNFRDGCNYSYLLKETKVPKAYGAKVTFPFLDIDLVQEFLWLTPELKNRHYKAPLYEYLVRNGVAFEYGKKRGFNPQ